jgi:hypothetical protein
MRHAFIMTPITIAWRETGDDGFGRSAVARIAICLLVSFACLFFAATAQAAPVDWCSKQSISSLPKSTNHGGWKEHKFKAERGWSEITWSSHQLPTRVLCFVHDDHEPPHSQQCYGLGIHDCLQGRVERRVSVWPGREFVSLIFSSEHARGFGSVTIYSDISPIYGSLRRAHHRARRSSK